MIRAGDVIDGETIDRVIDTTAATISGDVAVSKSGAEGASFVGSVESRGAGRPVQTQRWIDSTDQGNAYSNKTMNEFDLISLMRRVNALESAVGAWGPHTLFNGGVDTSDLGVIDYYDGKIYWSSAIVGSSVRHQDSNGNNTIFIDPDDGTGEEEWAGSATGLRISSAGYIAVSTTGATGAHGLVKIYDSSGNFVASVVPYTLVDTAEEGRTATVLGWIGSTLYVQVQRVVSSTSDTNEHVYRYDNNGNFLGSVSLSSRALAVDATGNFYGFDRSTAPYTITKWNSSGGVSSSYQFQGSDLGLTTPNGFGEMQVVGSRLFVSTIFLPTYAPWGIYYLTTGLSPIGSIMRTEGGPMCTDGTKLYVSTSNGVKIAGPQTGFHAYDVDESFDEDAEARIFLGTPDGGGSTPDSNAFTDNGCKIVINLIDDLVQAVINVMWFYKNATTGNRWGYSPAEIYINNIAETLSVSSYSYISVRCTQNFRPGNVVNIIPEDYPSIAGAHTIEYAISTYYSGPASSNTNEFRIPTDPLPGYSSSDKTGTIEFDDNVIDYIDTSDLAGFEKFYGQLHEPQAISEQSSAPSVFRFNGLAPSYRAPSVLDKVITLLEASSAY